MNGKAIILILALVLAPAATLAQGFAGMGQNPEGFALPDPATRFSFPEDHGAHPDFRIEWWYMTANLTGEDGRDYGMQWTLFRSAVRPGEAEGWASPQAWMGHAAVSTPDDHFVAERFARGGIGQAGVRAAPFQAWIDDWGMEGSSLSDVQVTAQGTDFAYNLRFKADRPFVPQGADGFSVKSEAGQASHYYSQPFYQVSGVLDLPDGPVAVTGQGWLDREWSSQPLTETQTGWDWFSLHLDSGDKLMGYRLRDPSGDAYIVGTWIDADGTPSPLPEGALTAKATRITRVQGRDVPTAWAVTLPERDLQVELTALNPQSWMSTAVPYWEGPVFVAGSHGGRGYLEMTGYD